MNIPTVYLTGVPNAGKTTLFNGLTGKNERVGNWYGVTTKAAEGYFKANIGDRPTKIRIIDLPGSYFDDYTLEQGETADKITDNGLIVVVCPANDLKGGLKFLKKVSVFNCSVVLVINFYNEFTRQNGKIDVNELRLLLGIPVVIAECNKKSGVNAVKNAVLSAIRKSMRLKSFDVDTVVAKVYGGKRECAIGKADKLLLKPAVSFIVIGITSVFALYMAFGRFGIGSLLEFLTELGLKFLIIKPISFLLNLLSVSPFVFGVITEGFIGGAVSVLAFLPRLAVLTLYTCIIEESGVLARFAFASHGLLSKVGMTGRAIFTLLTGFGCTAVAVISSCGLENKKIRKRAVLSLPFISCSAKVPVIAWISAFLGSKYGFFAVLLLWVCGLLLAFLFSFLTTFGSKKQNNLILEFPPYRIPQAKTIAKNLQNFAKSFIIRVGSIIALTSAFLWILKSLTADICFTADVRDSLLVKTAEKLQFVFYPAGVKNWQFAVAAFTGIFAKENVLSVFSLLGTGNASAKELFAFALFFALYPPCIGTLAAVLKQEGIKSLLHVVCLHYTLAFIAFYTVFKPYYALLLAAIVAIYLVKARKIRNTNCLHNEKDRCKRRLHGKQASYRRI